MPTQLYFISISIKGEIGASVAAFTMSAFDDKTVRRAFIRKVSVDLDLSNPCPLCTHLTPPHLCMCACTGIQRGYCAVVGHLLHRVCVYFLGDSEGSCARQHLDLHQLLHHLHGGGTGTNLLLIPQPQTPLELHLPGTCVCCNV